MNLKLLMLFFIRTVFSVQDERRGPPLKTKEVMRVIAKAGEDVRIDCPVRGSPHPIVEWSKVEKFLQASFKDICVFRMEN